MNIMAFGILLLVVAIGTAGRAVAQVNEQAPETPLDAAAAPSADSVVDKPDTADSAEPDSGEEALGRAALGTADGEAEDRAEAGGEDGTEDGTEDGVEDNSAVADAPAEATEIKATMERFVPSEQISEDRSVSFPNDI